MKNAATLKKISSALAILYAVMVGIIMTYAGPPTDISRAMQEFYLWLWAICPALLWLFFVCKFRAHFAKTILLVLQLLDALFSIYVYYDAFFVHLDAQNGLVFLFLPMLQYISVIVIAVAIKITQFTARLSRR